MDDKAKAIIILSAIILIAAGTGIGIALVARAAPGSTPGLSGIFEDKATTKIEKVQRGGETVELKKQIYDLNVRCNLRLDKKEDFIKYLAKIEGCFYELKDAESGLFGTLKAYGGQYTTVKLRCYKYANTPEETIMFEGWTKSPGIVWGGQPQEIEGTCKGFESNREDESRPARYKVTITAYQKIDGRLEKEDEIEQIVEVPYIPGR